MSDPTALPALETEATSGPDWKIPQFLRKNVENHFQKTFGRYYALERLEDLFTRVSTGGIVTDKEAVEIGLMYAYYLEHTAKQPVEAELLYLYLNQQKPTAFLPTSFPFESNTRRIRLDSANLTGDSKFDYHVCISATTILERAVEKRLINPAGPHPATAATLPKPDGTIEQVDPAASPLKSGGTETIYMEFNVTLPGDERIPIKQALGTITVFSKMTVTSIYDAAKETWTVATTEWENWGYDEGDFEWDELSKDPDDRKTQDLSISLDTILAEKFPFRDKVINWINKQYPDLDRLLKNFKVQDKYMSQIANKIITLDDNSVFAPKPYEIYIDSWFYQAAASPCPYGFKTLEFTSPLEGTD